MENNTADKRINEALSLIAKTVPEQNIMKDEPMSRHTSFRIGGPASALVMPRTEEELSAVMDAVSRTGADHMIIGNGSNLLVSDEGYRGIMIRPGGMFESIALHSGDDCSIRAGAAALLSRTSAFLTEHGLRGFEFASGIPGSIGGAVFMNAGAYGGEMKDVVTSVRMMTADGSSVREYSNADMDFGYRCSMAQKSGEIILSADMRFVKDAPEAIAERVSELQAKRNAKQPVNYPSAGSTFKRPAGGFAAALIEQSGLKGYRVGGAEVSEKHSGFVINTGGASCGDVLAVMRHVREKVYADSGIMLEPEVRLINCDL